MSDEYESLLQDCEFRMQILAPGYAAREVVPVGDWLYDPQLRWAEEDGSVVVSDIGGQPERGWDPQGGHGAIWRLRPDDDLQTICPLGMHGVAAPIRPALAPLEFAPWGGHILTIAQGSPGFDGAQLTHRLFRIDPDDGIPHEFAALPHAGSVAGGMPGAGMTGTFGSRGTPHEGYLYPSSNMNCAVYRVSADACIEPYVIMAPPIVDRPRMAFLTFIAPDHSQWKPYAGELIVATRNTTYLDKGPRTTDLEYWVVDASGRTVEAIPGITWRAGPIAPETFGAFAGHMLTVDEGSTNLLHADIAAWNEAPLPYDARILAIAPDGTEHVFAEGLQGGSTTLVFSGPRLLVGSSRKSYSTGAYHEPDGSIYEVTPTV